VQKVCDSSHSPSNEDLTNEGIPHQVADELRKSNIFPQVRVFHTPFVPVEGISCEHVISTEFLRWVALPRSVKADPNANHDVGKRGDVSNVKVLLVLGQVAVILHRVVFVLLYLCICILLEECRNSPEL
jgi:hypothetical protein